MAHAHRGRSGRRPERPVETFTTGLVFTIVFGTLTGVFHGAWWMVFPLVFAGILPMVRGISGMVGRRSAALDQDAPARQLPAAEEARQSRSRGEKELLAAAQQSDGIVTPAVAALKTSLSIDAADEMLQDLARRGHATMVVSDDGRVEYHFPEFRPRSGAGGQ